VLPHLGSGSALGRVQSWFSGGGDRSPGFADILDALSDPRDKTGRAYAQAVQRLLGSVRAKPGTATGPWIVAVAAPRAGCGASSTALALAYAAALAGERTLLVDAASANADLSGIFAPALDPGTVVVLDDKDDLAKITTRDVRSGLSFLPIALADIRRLKTSQRRRLADGLSALAQSYDFVFIDAGPLLEDEAARTLLPLADEILLVARPRRTAQSDLEEVEDLVASLANAPAGLVFNMNERGS
jgi:Mrp family chromosome partitioning ATPase